MAVKLGRDAKLYRNTVTFATPTWNEITNVKDVTLNLEAGKLVATPKCRGGQNGIAGSIRDFRKNAADALRECLGLVCGPQDFVRSGGPGYRFNEWISVRDATAANAGSRGSGDVPAKPGRDPANVPATATADSANDPANDGDDPANQRRRQILAELRKDRKLRTPAIAKELGCSEKTVKRELDALRAAGHIEFVGPTKTGYYRLKK